MYVTVNLCRSFLTYSEPPSDLRTELSISLLRRLVYTNNIYLGVNTDVRQVKEVQTPL